MNPSLITTSKKYYNVINLLSLVTNTIFYLYTYIYIHIHIHTHIHTHLLDIFETYKKVECSTLTFKTHGYGLSDRATAVFTIKLWCGLNITMWHL